MISRGVRDFVWLTDAFLLQGLQNLLNRIERMRGYGPEFIDITWFVSLAWAHFASF
jgi:hypothetical protein